MPRWSSTSVAKYFLGHCDYSLQKDRDRSGSVIECLTGDQGAPGSSLTGVTALCP